jgi:hypothetical protein
MGTPVYGSLEFRVETHSGPSSLALRRHPREACEDVLEDFEFLEIMEVSDEQVKNV